MIKIMNVLFLWVGKESMTKDKRGGKNYEGVGCIKDEDSTKERGEI
jgi:hypothetical protein